MIPPGCTSPGRGWWGRFEHAGLLERRRQEVRAAMAAALGVPADEVGVVEHPQPAGVYLVGVWPQ